ncbi:MAG: VanZ family protein [Chitinophagaceae bacterium]
MIKRLFSTVILPIAWFILIQVLLCLPGSDIPSGGMFDIPNLDKIVHVGLFGGLTFLWCYYFYLKGKTPTQLKTIFFIIYLLTCANGIILEFVQRDYIPNRSFDLGDIIADVLAASVAYGICNIRFIKTAA